MAKTKVLDQIAPGPNSPGLPYTIKVPGQLHSGITNFMLNLFRYLILVCIRLIETVLERKSPINGDIHHAQISDFCNTARYFPAYQILPNKFVQNCL